MITFKDLIKEPIHEVYEDSDFYYVCFKKDLGDDTAWKIDKKSNTIEFLPFVNFLFKGFDKGVKHLSPMDFVNAINKTN